MVFGIERRRAARAEFQATADQTLSLLMGLQVAAMQGSVMMAGQLLADGPDDAALDSVRLALGASRKLRGDIEQLGVGHEHLPRLEELIAAAEVLLADAPEPLF